MNTPNQCSDDTINELVEFGRTREPGERRDSERRAQPLPEPLGADGALPALEDLTPLYVHPDEQICAVVQALAVGGFGVYSVPSSGAGRPYLCIAQRWRIDLARKRAAQTPAQRAAEAAQNAAVQRSLEAGFE